MRFFREGILKNFQLFEMKKWARAAKKNLWNRTFFKELKFWSCVNARIKHTLDVVSGRCCGVVPAEIDAKHNSFAITSSQMDDGNLLNI